MYAAAGPMYPQQTQYAQVQYHQPVQGQRLSYTNGYQQMHAFNPAAAATQPGPVYMAPTDDEKQLDNDILTKLNALVYNITEKKNAITAQCAVANSVQKKDILRQLSRLDAAISSVQMNASIQGNVQQIPHAAQARTQPQRLSQSMSPMQSHVVTVTDTWNTNILDQKLQYKGQTVHVFSTGGWVAACGTQTVRKGQYKKWKVKMLATSAVQLQKKKNSNKNGVEVVVGVMDSKKTNNFDINLWTGEFWMQPGGYGYYGYSGKKFHKKKAGKSYGSKFNENDIVSIELSMQKSDLTFHVNDESRGVAFKVDDELSYVLVVALRGPECDMKIC